MAYQNDTANISRSLRAADISANSASRPGAGPFDIASAEHENETTTLPDALITGMLVIYPVLATVVAVIVGMSLSPPVV